MVLSQASTLTRQPLMTPGAGDIEKKNLEALPQEKKIEVHPSEKKSGPMVNKSSNFQIQIQFLCGKKFKSDPNPLDLTKSKFGFKFVHHQSQLTFPTSSYSTKFSIASMWELLSVLYELLSKNTFSPTRKP